MSLVLTDAALEAIAAGLVADGESDYDGPLTNLKCILFTNEPALNNLTVVGDLTEADYPGYARQAVAWSSILREADGSVAVTSQRFDFNPSSDPDPTVLVNGYGLCHQVTSGAPLVLYGAEQFANPVSLTDSLTACQFVARVSVPNDPFYGSAVQIR